MMPRPSRSSGPSTRLGGLGPFSSSAQMVALVRARGDARRGSRRSGPSRRRARTRTRSSARPSSRARRRRRTRRGPPTTSGCFLLRGSRRATALSNPDVSTPCAARSLKRMVPPAVALAYVVILSYVPLLCSEAHHGGPEVAVALHQVLDVHRRNDREGNLGLGQIVAQLLSIVMVVAAFALVGFPGRCASWARGRGPARESVVSAPSAAENARPSGHGEGHIGDGDDAGRRLRTVRCARDASRDNVQTRPG